LAVSGAQFSFILFHAKKSERTGSRHGNTRCRTKPALGKSKAQAELSSKRGFSSVGRASALQAECQRFESVNLHHFQIKAEKLKFGKAESKSSEISLFQRFSISAFTISGL